MIRSISGRMIRKYSFGRNPAATKVDIIYRVVPAIRPAIICGRIPEFLSIL
jgi:hypothetical protein